MSSHYSAGQFDHAFAPQRLKNYEYGFASWPGRNAVCSQRPKGPTGFIANDHGHLLPCIPRDPCSSLWGNYNSRLDTFKSCLPLLRHPENYLPEKEIYIARDTCRPCLKAPRLRTLIGDRDLLQKVLRAQRRCEKRLLYQLGQKRYLPPTNPETLNFRFATNCGSQMKGCKKWKLSNRKPQSTCFTCWST